MIKHTTTATTNGTKTTTPATETPPGIPAPPWPDHLRFEPLSVLEEARAAVCSMMAAFCLVDGAAEGMRNAEDVEDFNAAAAEAMQAMRLVREILEHDAAQAKAVAS